MQKKLEIIPTARPFQILSCVIVVLLCGLTIINFLAVFVSGDTLLGELTHSSEERSIYIITVSIFCTAMALFTISTVLLSKQSATEPSQENSNFPIQVHSTGFKRLALCAWVMSYISLLIYMIHLWADDEIEGMFALLVTIFLPVVVSFILWLIIMLQGWVVEGFSSDLKKGTLKQEVFLPNQGQINSTETSNS